MRTVHPPLRMTGDHDKDLKTEAAGGLRAQLEAHSRWCESPPPLPCLIFDGQFGKLASASLVGSECLSRSALCNTSQLSCINNNGDMACFPSAWKEDGSSTDNSSYLHAGESLRGIPDSNSNTDTSCADLQHPSLQRLSRAPSRPCSSHLSPRHGPGGRSTKRSLSHQDDPLGSLNSKIGSKSSRQTRPSCRSSSAPRAFGCRPSPFLSSSAADLLRSAQDTQEFIAALRKERSRLLQEIESEERERSWFLRRLQLLYHQLASIPPSSNGGYEVGRVEGEIRRVEEAFRECLGPPEVMVQRREDRLHTINSIEKTIQKLQQEPHFPPFPSSQEGDRSALRPSYYPEEKASQFFPEHPSRVASFASSAPNNNNNSIDNDTGTLSAMDTLNANQVADEDATAEDISELRELDSVSSEHFTLCPSQQESSDKTCPLYYSANASSVSPPHDASDATKIPPALEAVLKGTWPFDKALWHSSPASVGVPIRNGSQEGVPGLMSTSSVTSRRAQSQQQLLSNKVEMVYGLLSMFSSGDRDDMSRTLLAMSSSPDSCVAMRQSGCLPLLIQLLHGTDGDMPPTRETRLRASQALHNMVHSHSDDKRGRREARVLRLLEQIRDYSDYLYERLERTSAGKGPLLEDDMERHPCPAMAALMKLSFDEDHRHAMCALGGLHAIAELIRRDHDAHGSITADQFCITLRRYSGMALTNLTFGDGTNKSLLCSFRAFMRALVSQLHSPSEELRQVTASVLRNLSWRADSASKKSLRDVGAVTSLMQAALSAVKESTLKVILSATWNLSAHCSENKADICEVAGALAFICSTLTYKSQSKTLAIIENGSGILRNISSHIAVREDLRQVLREHSTLNILLGQLKSPSLTVVSNACGTLWNLSARCATDQRTLWELGAVPMLRSLINSKHKMISMGSNAALKNLLHARPEGIPITDTRHSMGFSSLQTRKQMALEQELDPSLSETCDNIEASPRASPTETSVPNPFLTANGNSECTSMYSCQDGSRHCKPMFTSLGNNFDPNLLSESKDSLLSTVSDSTHDRMRAILFQQQRHLSESSGDLDLPFQQRALPSHAVPDIACLNTEEMHKYLDLRELNGSIDELFLAQMRHQKLGSASFEPKQPSSSAHRRTSESRINGQPPLLSAESHHTLYNKYIKRRPEVNSDEDNDDDHDDDDDDEVDDAEEILSDSQIDSIDQFPYKPSEETAQSNGNGKLPFVKVNNYVVNHKLKGEPGQKPYNHRSYAEEIESDDIEQPTNYSLRYSEERDPTDSHSKAKDDQDPYLESYIHDDSVKTYCTEGTPYETPFNFSTATSMSDLRELGSKDEDKKNLHNNLSQAHLATDQSENGCAVNKTRLTSLENGQATLDSVTLGGHGSISPSISSPFNVKIREEPASSVSKEFLHTADVTIVEPGDQILSEHQEAHSYGKMAPCEDTPLMFSRATSASSLSSFEVKSINDDRSSALSDNSRITSGAISPSDLPDSPSQTLPPSPRRPGLPASSSFRKPLPSASTGVFGDTARAFNVEGTPLEFSRASSPLSILTVEDDNSSFRGVSQAVQRVRGDGKDSSEVTSNEVSRPSSRETHPGRKMAYSGIPRAHSRGRPAESTQRTSEAAPVNSVSVARASLETQPEAVVHSRSDSESEKLLAACIRDGMPCNSSCSTSANICTPRGSGGPVKSPRPPSGTILSAAPVPPLPRPKLSDLHQSFSSDNLQLLHPSAIPIKTANIQVTTTTLVLPPSETKEDGERWNGNGSCGDALKNYCTEDTPASTSKCGSISDLSQLSIPTESSAKLILLKDSSDNTPEQNSLLEQCIKSAMPKGRPSPKTKDLIVSTPLGHCNSMRTPRFMPHSRSIPVARVSPAVHISENKSQLHGACEESAKDEARTFAVEGTPLEFSASTSLSDLTIESSELSEPAKPQLNGDSDAPGSGACNGIPAHSVKQKTSTMLPRFVPKKRNNNNNNQYEDEEEVPKKYVLENTPKTFSRTSSLSSLDEGAREETSYPEGFSKKAPLHSYDLEDTPVCFSRNSSLSSLSVESYGEETTATEQALLQQCINQGMPKSKSDLSDRKVMPRRGRRSANSRIPAPSRSPGRMIPGIPMQRLNLVPVGSSEQIYTSSEDIMATSSADAESCKLLSESRQNEKSLPIDEEESKSTEVEESESEATTCRLDEKTFEGKPPANAITSDESPVTIVPFNETCRVSPERQNGCLETCHAMNSSKSSGSGSGEMKLSSDFSLQLSLSESGLAQEADRVAKAVASEGRAISSDETSQFSCSLNSDGGGIELMKPPSAMGSLVSLSNSMSNSMEEGKLINKPHNRHFECRHTKRVPEMVRRALGDCELQGEFIQGNANSLASSCHSNIENIVPPSLLDDDMENSMISVASITSEIAELKTSVPSVNTDVLAEIQEPAQRLASFFQKEALNIASTVTLTAGEDSSTYQEITEIDRDETLDAPASDEENPPDIPDLPPDSPAVSRSNKVKGSPRNLTPKTRRARDQDRYRTFTKTGSSCDAQSCEQSSHSPEAHRGARQRRQEDADRFKTRTITTPLVEPPSVDDATFTVEAKKKNELEDGETSALETPNRRQARRRSFKQRRLDDPSRYQTRIISVPMNQLAHPKSGENESEVVEFQDGEDIGLTAEQLEVLSQDANIVICTLNENREGMMQDSCELMEENILDIETLSLISNDGDDAEEEIDDFPKCPESTQDVELNGLSHEGGNLNEIVRRPRIVKPGEETTRVPEEDSTGKGIRGRRKGLFSFSRKKPATSRSNDTGNVCQSKNVARPLRAAQPPSSPKLPRPTRASTLRHHSSVTRSGSTSEDSGGVPTAGSSPRSSAGSSPRLSGVPNSKAVVPVTNQHATSGNINRQSSSFVASKAQDSSSHANRQQTFTKDAIGRKLRAPQAPVPPEVKKTLFGNNTQKLNSKSKLRKDVVQPCPSTSYPAGVRIEKALGRSESQEAVVGNSKASQSKSVSLTRDVHPPTAKEVAEWKEDLPKEKTKVKKEVTSRIASLWKRVEKAQSGKSNEKDKRVWISSSHAPTEATPKSLVRSSTFEKLPGFDTLKEASSESKPKSKLGLRLSRFKSRDSKSSPPSEVTTPLNGKPKCSVNPTPVVLREKSSPSSVTNEEAKRLSRLGSFIVVDDPADECKMPQAAVVAPFNLQCHSGRSLTNATKIPQLQKISNNPRDDNGNSAFEQPT